MSNIYLYIYMIILWTIYIKKKKNIIIYIAFGFLVIETAVQTQYNNKYIVYYIVSVYNKYTQWPQYRSIRLCWKQCPLTIIILLYNMYNVYNGVWICSWSGLKNTSAAHSDTSFESQLITYMTRVCVWYYALKKKMHSKSFFLVFQAFLSRRIFIKFNIDTSISKQYSDVYGIIISIIHTWIINIMLLQRLLKKIYI